MFEFAISQNRKRSPSRLFWVSAAVSVTAHAAVLIILLENPWLLGPGLSHWLERIQIALRSTPKSSTADEGWRMVALAGDPSRMRAPSAAQLKSLMPDWDKAGSSGRMPPIQIRWRDGKVPEIETAVKVSKPAPGPKDSAPAPPAVAQGQTTAGAAQGDNPSEAPGGARVTIPLPAPSVEPRPAPPKVAETSPNAAPKTIPNSVKVEPPPTTASAPPPPPSPKSQAQVFQDERQALRSDGSGLFDTKGFPLGDYASAIIERVKTNWSIPSNLRSSQGRTTVVFYIGKDGRYTDAHIVASSGSRSLDIAALNAVLISSPFPPLPRGFPGDQVGAKFVFSYNERQ
jgi:periplasmic protein TonB